MNTLFSENLKKIEIYSLPFAAFFLLISTAALNFFIVITVLSGLIRIIFEKKNIFFISKKFMLYALLIFLFLLLSSYYTIGNFENMYITLKKYIKFLYLPILFYHIKVNQNQILIIKFLLAGGFIVLFLSYLKYFDIVSFSNLYSFFEMNLVGTISHASVFQTSIVHGVVFSFLFYLSIYMAKKQNNNYLYIFSILCFFNIVFMNDSRNSYLVIFFLILSVIYFYFNKRKYMVTTISLIFIFSLSILPTSNTFKKTLTDTVYDIKLLVNDNYTSSIGLRSLWILNGVENIYKRPLFGAGVGSYENTIENFIKKNDINVDKNLAVSNNPHNEFISLSTQLGLFGLLLYILFLYELYKDSRKKFLSTGAFVIVLISSFFNALFYDNVFGLFMIIVISLVYQEEFDQ